MDWILRWAISCLALSVSLQVCTSSSIVKGSGPLSRPATEPMGVRLILVATTPRTAVVESSR